jgi:hypothetical protein
VAWLPPLRVSGSALAAGGGGGSSGGGSIATTNPAVGDCAGAGGWLWSDGMINCGCWATYRN